MFLAFSSIYRVNNCVNYTNYKFFILFLGWGLTYCLFCSLSSFKYFLMFWNVSHHWKQACGIMLCYSYLHKICVYFQGSDRQMSNLHIVFVFFAGIMFSVSLSFLFIYHIYLVCVNRSTLGESEFLYIVIHVLHIKELRICFSIAYK